MRVIVHSAHTDTCKYAQRPQGARKSKGWTVDGSAGRDENCDVQEPVLLRFGEIIASRDSAAD